MSSVRSKRVKHKHSKLGEQGAQEVEDDWGAFAPSGGGQMEDASKKDLREEEEGRKGGSSRGTKRYMGNDEDFLWEELPREVGGRKPKVVIRETFQGTKAKADGLRFIKEIGPFLAKPRKGRYGQDVLVNHRWVRLKDASVEMALRTGFLRVGDTGCRLEIPRTWPSHVPVASSERFNIVQGILGIEAYVTRTARILGVTLPEPQTMISENAENWNEFEGRGTEKIARRFVEEFGAFMAKPRQGNQDRDCLIRGEWVPTKFEAVDIGASAGFIMRGTRKDCRLGTPPGWPDNEPRISSERTNLVVGVPGMEAYTRRLAGILNMTLPPKEEFYNEEELREDFKDEEAKESARKFIKEFRRFMMRPRKGPNNQFVLIAGSDPNEHSSWVSSKSEGIKLAERFEFYMRNNARFEMGVPRKWPSRNPWNRVESKNATIRITGLCKYSRQIAAKLGIELEEGRLLGPNEAGSYEARKGKRPGGGGSGGDSLAQVL